MSNHNQDEKDQVVAVEFQDNKVYLTVADGGVVGNPLDWYPWLAAATPEQRASVEMYVLSVYWPELDDGLDVAEMLKGIPPRIVQRA